MTERLRRSVVLIALAAAAAAEAQPGWASEPPAGPSSSAPAIDGPIDAKTAPWRRLPTGDEVEQLYPRKAWLEGVGGRVRVRCSVTPSGDMADCMVISESPPNYGFGKMGLALTRFCHLRKGSYGPHASIDIPFNLNFGHGPP